MATLNTVTSSTRPASPAAGEAYFETDTNKIIVWTGSEWTEIHSDTAPSFSNTYSVEFDGTNDFVSTGLDVGGASALTVSAWVKHDTLGAKPGIATQYAGSGSSRAFRFALYSGATGLLVNCYTSGGTTQAAYPSPGVSTGTWYHAAFVFSGTSLKVYFNGDNTPAGATSTFSSTTLNTGGNQVNLGAFDNSSNYLDGNLDEVGIWTSALSASDISDIYNSGVPADLTSYSPNGWWRMGDDDSGSGTTITDQGSGGNDGTLTNGPTFSTDVPS